MTDNATAANADGANAPETNVPEIPVETSSPEPLVVASDEPVIEAEAAAEAADPAAAPADGDQVKKPVQKLPDWAQKKLNEQAFEAREAKRRAKELEDELTRLKAPTPSAADTAAAQANAPSGGYKSPAEFDAAVQAEAARREVKAQQDAAVKDFNTRSDAAFNKGVETFGDDFKSAVSTLQQTGIMEPNFVALVLESDDPSKVLMELGRDPDKAMHLMSLTPAKQAMEVARLSASDAPKAEPTRLSSAPRPVATVEGSARVTSEPGDADDDATWFAKRNQQIRQRNSGAAL